jgi:F420H(2)-dependent quinone reductase
MKIGSLAKMGVHFVSIAHASAYRLFGGRVAMGERTLLLTTKGRKTGKENTKPLFYVEEGGRLYIVASYGGNDSPRGGYAHAYNR